jgi:hypothetical protein
MRPIDLLTFIGLTVGLILAVAAGIIIKRKIVPLERMPRIIGIGSFIFAFVFFMISSLTYRRPAEVVDYTATNIVLAAGIAIGGYVSIVAMVRRNRRR